MITIEYKGKLYSDFEAVEITHAIDTLPITASIKMVGHSPFVGGNATISINDKNLFTGPITSCKQLLSSNTHLNYLVITDPSYLASESCCTPREWENSALINIAKDLLAPFGLSVTGEVGPTIERWGSYPLENLFHNLDQLLEMNDSYAVSDGMGGICIKNKHSKITNIPRYSISRTISYEDFIPKQIVIYSDNQIIKKGDGIIKNYIGSKSLLDSKSRSLGYQGRTLDLSLMEGSYFDYEIGQTITTDGVDGDFILFKKQYQFNIETGESLLLFCKGAG